VDVVHTTSLVVVIHGMEENNTNFVGGEYVPGILIVDGITSSNNTNHRNTEATRYEVL
jgi:hypothetical protein